MAVCTRLIANRKSVSEFDVASLVAAEEASLECMVDEDDSKAEESGTSRVARRTRDGVLVTEDDCNSSADQNRAVDLILPERIDASDPKMPELLLRAISVGKLSATRRLIHSGVALRSRHIRVAARRGHVGLLQFLLVQVPRQLRGRLAKSALPYASTRAHRFLRQNYEFN